MKRYLVTSVRESTDAKTGDSLLFVNLYKLPSRTKAGNLWYPKQNEAAALACINEKNNKAEYDKLKNVLPGALADVTLGVNDFNGKSFVARIDIVAESPFSTAELYL